MDDFPIVESELCTAIEEDGMLLQIHIYRGVDELGWILDVEDHYGTHAVWDERFPTDRAALECALKEIRENGADSLTRADIISFPSS